MLPKKMEKWLSRLLTFTSVVIAIGAAVPIWIFMLSWYVHLQIYLEAEYGVVITEFGDTIMSMGLTCFSVVVVFLFMFVMEGVAKSFREWYQMEKKSVKKTGGT